MKSHTARFVTAMFAQFVLLIRFDRNNRFHGGRKKKKKKQMDVSSAENKPSGSRQLGAQSL